MYLLTDSGITPIAKLLRLAQPALRQYDNLPNGGVSRPTDRPSCACKCYDIYSIHKMNHKNNGVVDRSVPFCRARPSTADLVVAVEGVHVLSLGNNIF